MIQGYATADKTKAYADRMWEANNKLNPNSWKIVEGCTVSKIGFGSYRIVADNEHETALRKALLSGVNLIDTASNYTDGQAETIIGKTLTALIENKEIAREEIMLISKGGYIQGGALLHAQTKEIAGTIKLNEHLWYSIHPENLEIQIGRSKERLNVETLDGYLIHNPEYILGYKAMQNGDVSAKDQDEFYAQIEQSFTYLEEQVKEGAIQFYGVSSNSFGAPEDQPDYISLQKLFEAAQSAAQKAWGRKKRPSFRMVQMPMNIMELGTLHRENNIAKTFDGDEKVSALELASRMKLAVLTNRPLNAFPMQGGTYRIAQPTALLDSHHFEEALDKIKESEDALNKVLEGWPQVDSQPLFSFTNQGDQLLEHMTGSIQYDHLTSTFIYPHLTAFNNALTQLKENQPEKAESIQLVQQKYNQNMQQLLLIMRQMMRQKDAEAIRPIELELRDRAPEKWKSAPVQQIALNAIASLPGVSCVLSGMRHEDYVNDAIACIEMGDFADPAAIIGSTLNTDAA